ncbi:single-stranded DNA-binding protein [Streptomyces sp. NPDC058372]|uniref:single-stranded DNA-binding protein n=1 Tax=Streptomyces sp. NPDC058372 TaxID=3346464 RepID=UPI003649DA8F
MNETMVTVVGNVATTPVYRESAQGPMARFRMAATPRRWDRQRQGWSDGPTSFFTVWTTRQLASNVTASITVGEPVIVQGRLRVRETERGGQQWTTAEIDAASVGHDLNRGTAAFRRVRRPTGTWPATNGTQDTRSASAAQRAAGGGDSGFPDGGGAPDEGGATESTRPVTEPDWSASGVAAGGEWGARGGGTASAGADGDGEADGDEGGGVDTATATATRDQADVGPMVVAGAEAEVEGRRRGRATSKGQAGTRKRGRAKAEPDTGVRSDGETGPDVGALPPAPGVSDTGGA